MPTPTYDLIASNVLGSSASSVTFSAIPATYRDLIVVINAIAPGGAILARYNSDTGSNYNFVRMFADGSSAYSNAYTNQNSNDIGIGGANGNVSILQIMDYSATDKHKSSLSRSNDPSYVWAHAHRWANTSAITAVQIYGSTFSTGSSFYLYGIVS